MTGPLRCVIVDDRQEVVADLTRMLQPHAASIRPVGVASSVSEAVRLLADVRPDVVFLDVDLGDGTGFDVLEALKPDLPIVVFVSASSHHTLQAFRVNAVDYLLKPVQEDELADVILKCRRQSATSLNAKALEHLFEFTRGGHRPPQRLVIPQESRLRVVPLESIRFVEGDSSYCRIHLDSGESVHASMTLSDIEGAIGPDRLFRSHKSYLVNLDLVRELRTGEAPTLVLAGGQVLPVARRRVKDLSDSLRRNA